MSEAKLVIEKDQVDFLLDELKCADDLATEAAKLKCTPAPASLVTVCSQCKLSLKAFLESDEDELDITEHLMIIMWLKQNSDKIKEALGLIELKKLIEELKRNVSK